MRWAYRLRCSFGMMVLVMAGGLLGCHAQTTPPGSSEARGAEGVRANEPNDPSLSVGKLEKVEPGQIGEGQVDAAEAGEDERSGRLPPEIIQRVVRAAYNRLRGCYESGLRRDPELSGKIVSRFVISRDGSVESSTADGEAFPDKEVVDCVAGVISSLVFPEPEGGIVTVVYPFSFSPQ